MKRLLHLPSVLGLALGVAALAALTAGCDSGVSGEPGGNQPPSTELFVRDTSLVGNIGEEDRLTSTVYVAWSGTDPDGFVVGYELRYYDEGEAPGEWRHTTRRDTLILLPIPPGEDRANVVFEVRAIDNEGARDPNPARTVFPIRNSPPSLRLSSQLVPADTTWPVVSFGWTATDPDGPESLAGVEIALNDTTEFHLVPPEVELITLSAADPQAVGETEAQVFYGPNLVPAGFSLPGLRLEAENVLYLRALDLPGARSRLVRFPAEEEDSWFVRRQTSEVLLVNDYRRAEEARVMPYHRGLLERYSGAFDEWDLSRPLATGSNPLTSPSDALPSPSNPTLRQTLALWRYIYWVSDQTTDRVEGYNFPEAASVIDRFFDGGGRLFVQVPVRLPTNPEDNRNNAAVNVLPLGGLITIPDTLVYNNLRLPNGAAIEPVQPVPGVGQRLPALRTRQLITGTLPYLPGESVPLAEAEYVALRVGGGQVPWAGSRTVASMSPDRRVALLALPVVNAFNGTVWLEGSSGETDAPEEAIRLILEGLEFPR